MAKLDFLVGKPQFLYWRASSSLGKSRLFHWRRPSWLPDFIGDAPRGNPTSALSTRPVVTQLFVGNVPHGNPTSMLETLPVVTHLCWRCPSWQPDLFVGDAHDGNPTDIFVSNALHGNLTFSLALLLVATQCNPTSLKTALLVET